jgi:hypothetical protein
MEFAIRTLETASVSQATAAKTARLAAQWRMSEDFPRPAVPKVIASTGQCAFVAKAFGGLLASTSAPEECSTSATVEVRALRRAYAFVTGRATDPPARFLALAVSPILALTAASVLLVECAPAFRMCRMGSTVVRTARRVCPHSPVHCATSCVIHTMGSWLANVASAPRGGLVRSATFRVPLGKTWKPAAVVARAR